MVGTAAHSRENGRGQYDDEAAHEHCGGAELVREDAHDRRQRVHARDVQAHGQADQRDRRSVTGHVDRGHRHDRDHHGVRHKDAAQRRERRGVTAEGRECH